MPVGLKVKEPHFLDTLMILNANAIVQGKRGTKASDPM
jgi:hypothetical protein